MDETPHLSRFNVLQLREIGDEDDDEFDGDDDDTDDDVDADDAG